MQSLSQRYIPATSVVVALVDFAISFCMLIVLMMMYGMTPDWKIIFLPFFLLIAVLTSLGAGIFISVLLSIIIFIGGFKFFMAKERYFADTI